MKYFWADKNYNILIKISSKKSILSYVSTEIIYYANIIYSIVDFEHSIQIQNVKCRYYSPKFKSTSVIELLQTVINDIKIINQYNTDNNYTDKMTMFDESSFLANLYNILSSNNMLNNSIKHELNYNDFKDYIKYKSNKITDIDYFFPK